MTYGRYLDTGGRVTRFDGEETFSGPWQRYPGEEAPAGEELEQGMRLAGAMERFRKAPFSAVVVEEGDYGAGEFTALLERLEGAAECSVGWFVSADDSGTRSFIACGAAIEVAAFGSEALRRGIKDLMLLANVNVVPEGWTLCDYGARAAGRLEFLMGEEAYRGAYGTLSYASHRVEEGRRFTPRLVAVREPLREGLTPDVPCRP